MKGSVCKNCECFKCVHCVFHIIFVQVRVANKDCLEKINESKTTYAIIKKRDRSHNDKRGTGEHCGNWKD